MFLPPCHLKLCCHLTSFSKKEKLIFQIFLLNYNWPSCLLVRITFFVKFRVSWEGFWIVFTTFNKQTRTLHSPFRISFFPQLTKVYVHVKSNHDVRQSAFDFIYSFSYVYSFFVRIRWLALCLCVTLWTKDSVSRCRMKWGNVVGKTSGVKKIIMMMETSTNIFY